MAVKSDLLLHFCFVTILQNACFYVEYTASSRMKILRENIYKSDLSAESINILGILALGSLFWIDLSSLEYLRPK